MKKALILLIALLIVMFSLLGAAPNPADQNKKSTKSTVEELIDKAGYCYGILEDYPRALKYLNRAVEEARAPHLKADALLKTAYVYFLMGKSVSRYKTFILEAIKHAPSLNPEPIYYKKRFLDIFKALKKEPLADAAEIQVKTIDTQSGPRDKKDYRFFVKADLGYLLSNDEDYKAIYGNGSTFPQLKAGLRMARYLYIWAGYGSTSSDGTIPAVNADSKAVQHFLSFGLRYNRNISKMLEYKIEASIVSVSYKEEALDLTLKESAGGFGVETGLVFAPGNRFFTELSAGYIQASDIVVEERVKLGGFTAGLGVGVRF
ncbi:MAG: hypothetical protein GY950_02890 [bacterium]|nr:hypothetical protein [bacterium]